MNRRERMVKMEQFRELLCDGTALTEACGALGLARSTAARWKSELGLYQEPRGGDTPAQVRMCLRCTRAHCTGACRQVLEAGR